MQDKSNFDREKLLDLILEMEKSIFRISPGANHESIAGQLPKIKDDVDELRDFVIELAKIIYSLTPSSYLKGVVNSVIDTISVDDALNDLKSYNKRPASKTRNNDKHKLV